MVKYFWTPEEAALFAALRRSEGFFAETCDGAAARFWGPLAVGGCRVVYSETAGEGQVGLPHAGPVAVFLLWVGRFWIWVSLLFGIPVLLYQSFRGVENLGLARAALGGFLLAALLFSMVMLALALSALTQKWRRAMAGESSLSGHLLVLVVAALGYLLALQVFLGLF